MKSKSFFLVIFAITLFLFLSCSKDDNDNDKAKKGNLKVEITDAPVDDANVEAVFITVADIKVDGNSLEGFNKTTLDLMAYQHGNTFLLMNTDMEARSYSSIELILDYDTDANGNQPGCYVMEKEGDKHRISTNTNRFDMHTGFNVEADKVTNLVIDFDLRKTIKRSDGGDSDYALVEPSHMNNCIRVVSRTESGVISGSCNDLLSGSDMIVVYAYHKGTFNRETETQGSAESNILFHKAVNSSRLDANGNYELHFLKQGEYELHFASYQRNLLTGRMELKGTLILDVLSAIDLGSVAVNAESTTTVNVEVTGILPV